MKFNLKWLPAILLLALLPVSGRAANPRLTEDFDAHWQFSRGDFATAMMPAFDDSGWQPVNVPHDWSSDGPFTTNGASGTGYAPGGIGWYRKHFQLNADDAGKSISIEFDGVYDHSEVWINGQFVGGRPYGFSSFALDLTPFVRFGSSDNVIAVRVDHSRVADARYYTGSGIYRNVRLVLKDKLHVAHWGVFVTTPKVTKAAATVRIQTQIENGSATNQAFQLETEILAPDDRLVASAKTAAKLDKMPSTGAHAPARELIQQLVIRQPRRWSPEEPQLYRVVSKIVSGGMVRDQVTNTFGIRTFQFDANQGFSLNGKTMKLKGVCLHHDAGSIGAAVPEPVLERRLRALKEIGVNAIRTSHNPPDPGLLDLCDRLGFLVMDEAFDEFTPGKNKWVTGRNYGVPSHYGYNEMFADWAVRDVEDLVRRDRNHPGIILWSIGNEVDFANDPFSDPSLGNDYRPQNPPATELVKCARPLVAAVKSLDPTRPVTAALATVKMSNAVGLPELLDVVGYNYQEWRYAGDHREFPRRIIYGSENSHSYEAWMAVKTNAFIAGQFLWTGADYLGEANRWPNRASGAGLLDLCSFKKPLAWFRQSLWSDQPMVYLCATRGGGRRNFGAEASWNWRTNEDVHVLCFANCPEVTLKLNGKIIGTKTLADARNGVLHWQVPFEPGTLEAVGSENGQETCRFSLQTAGAAARIQLLPDNTRLRADSQDISQIEFRIVDANGVRVPEAHPEITFHLSGPAEILGIGNGDLNSVENCHTHFHHAFQGRGLLILETRTTPGDIRLQATSPGLEPASVTLHSR